MLSCKLNMPCEASSAAGVSPRLSVEVLLLLLLVCRPPLKLLALP
jgi:hypothetical protein